jgi:hypothetical protein
MSERDTMRTIPHRSFRQRPALQSAPKTVNSFIPVAIIIMVSSVLTTMALASPAHAKSLSLSIRRSTDPFAAFVNEASQRFDVPTSWIRAVMRIESRGNIHATSPKGAMGLMQIMPSTWATLRVRHGLGRNPYDPRDNILAGAAFLRELHDRYGSPGFLAAYNAGPGRYESYLTTGRPLPAETQAYVAAIAPLIGEGPVDGALIAASAARLRLKSSLFIMRTDGSPTVKWVSPTAQPNRQSDALRVVDLSGLVPGAGNLFVQLFARERAR